MNDFADIMLKERVCDATQRIPTGRWPLFSTTLQAQIAVGATQPPAPLEFIAERDTTFTDLSVTVRDSVTLTNVPARIDLEYCNVDYAEGTDAQEFTPCCSRKPLMWIGVRENKRLRLIVTTAAAVAVNPADVIVTWSGFQGSGCCP